MAKKIFSFRMDPDLIARVDGVGGDRTAFVTAAVEVALGIAERPSPVLTAEQAMEPNELLQDLPMKKVSGDVHQYAPKHRLPEPQKKNSTAGASKQKADQARVALRAVENAKRNYDDEAFLLDFLRCGVRTERQIAKEIRWPEMRVSKAVARLGAAGKVKFSSGAIEVCDV